jgi:MFS family permease
MSYILANTLQTTAPVISDCWRSEERGKAFAVITFVPLLGPALGPIVGGFVTQGLNWPWLFWILSIFQAFITILFFFLFGETHHPTILAQKAKQLQKSTGQPYYTAYQKGDQSFLARLRTALVRPCRLLLTQPVLQIAALVMAVSFGILYLVLTTFSSLWTDHYHMSTNISSLHYLALVIGYICGSQVGGYVMDFTWRRLTARNSGTTAPEYRVPPMIPTSVLLPMGLLWYGWAAQAHSHWIVVDLGIGLYGFSTIMGGYALQAYVLEAFPQHTASATAASQLLRNLFAFAFPIFAPSLYSRLGWGWGNTTLAGCWAVVGGVAPWIIWRWGRRLREKGVAVL